MKSPTHDAHIVGHQGTRLWRVHIKNISTVMEKMLAQAEDQCLSAGRASTAVRSVGQSKGLVMPQRVLIGMRLYLPYAGTVEAGATHTPYAQLGV